MADKTKITIVALATIASILAIVVVYAFIIQPSVSGYATDRRAEGAQIAVVQIAQLAAECQPVPVPLELGGNETINLIAAECVPERFPELFGEEGSQQ